MLKLHNLLLINILFMLTRCTEFSLLLIEGAERIEDFESVKAQEEKIKVVLDVTSGDLLPQSGTHFEIPLDGYEIGATIKHFRYTGELEFDQNGTMGEPDSLESVYNNSIPKKDAEEVVDELNSWVENYKWNDDVITVVTMSGSEAEGIDVSFYTKDPTVDGNKGGEERLILI